MKKLVLHQAGELAELRHVPPEKIDPMHHSQNASDFAFARHDRLEYFLRAAVISIIAGNQPEIAGEKIREVGTEVEVAFLGDLEHLHHGTRVFLENIQALGKKLALVNAEKAESFRSCLEARQKAEERARCPGGTSARE